MPQDLRVVAEAYQGDWSKYKDLANLVADKIRVECQEIGLRPTISARPKDLQSLIKKCLKYGGSIDHVRDRAGVKVVARYEEEIARICNLIQEKFQIVSGPDVKKSSYKPEELGYLGIHYHVKLRPDDGDSELTEFECEIILHTGAETLWDSISHELIYKPLVELPPSSHRMLLRLLALVELFDKEVAAVRHEYVSSPDYEVARILDTLEKYFYRIDPRPYSRALSVQTIEILKPAIDPEIRDHFDREMESFFNSNRPALEIAYKQHTNDYEGTFLHQPESLLVFALFDWYKKDEVKRLWLDAYPRETLETLGSVWGVSIP